MMPTSYRLRSLQPGRERAGGKLFYPTCQREHYKSRGHTYIFYKFPGA